MKNYLLKFVYSLVLFISFTLTTFAQPEDIDPHPADEDPDPAAAAFDIRLIILVMFIGIAFAFYIINKRKAALDAK